MFVAKNRALFGFCSILLVAIAGEGSRAATVHANSEAPPNRAMVLPENASSVTQGELQIDGRGLAYTATAAALTVHDKEGKAFGRLFFVAYKQNGQRPEGRPLTFVFNGGPGAASAYLHLGALGPRRVVFNPDGTLPPPPVRLAENAASWLPFTDLVFVDPVGTGYSRALPSEDKKEPDNTGKSWGVRQDAAALASFIRSYLTREQRWTSPRFLAGESYGGFRVGLLSQVLPAEYGIALNGVVMVSPALEFSLLRHDPLTLLPWAAVLPSYAAAAKLYGKSALPSAPAGGLRSELSEVESFALSDLLTNMAKGSTIQPAQEESWISRLAAFTGLSPAVVRQNHAQIDPALFVKELLRDKRLIVSMYDASVTAIDEDPGAQTLQGGDPYLYQVTSIFTAGFNSYVRETLKFETDLPYLVLNRQVSRDWNWASGIEGGQGFVGVTDQLKSGMTLNPAMKVLIAHGAYDLVTPYFGSVIAVNLIDLDPSLRGNLQIKVYEGGHMLYTRTESRDQLRLDAASFYQSARMQPHS